MADEAGPFQAAACAVGLGVAVEGPDGLHFLNDRGRELFSLVDAPGAKDRDPPAVSVEALAAKLQDPDAFLAWWRGTGAPRRRGRFRTIEGQVLEIDVGGAPTTGAGPAVWSIREGGNGVGSQEELLSALRAQEAAGKAKSDLLAMMSHEIRTPMNAILGMTELLLSTPLTRDQWNLLDTVRSAGSSLVGILDGVLEISKVGSGTLPLRTRPFSLVSLLESMAEEMAPLAADNGLELSCRVDARIPDPLEGDPHRIRQIFMNFLGNAVKFTRSGGVLLGAELAGEDEDGVEVRVWVEDTGPGIPSEDLDRIFDPFFQSDRRDLAEGRGVGLGLSIVRSLVEMMRGVIEVRSTPGQGTTFAVALSMGRCEGRFPKRRVSDQTFPEIQGILFSPSERLRSAAAEIFVSVGLTAVISRDPEELVGLLADVDPGRPAVVFADQRLRPEELEWIRHRLSLVRGELDVSLVILIPPGSPQPRRASASSKTYSLHKPMTRRMVAGVLQEIQGEPIAPGEPPESEVDDSAPRLKGLRVLLVEDRAENRFYLAHVLRMVGMHVDEVSDGEIAAYQFRTRPYDVVLTDLHMPEMDGFGLLENIRGFEAQAGRDPVPVIAMTALAVPGISQRCFAAGMDAFLTKPLGRTTLLEAIRDATGRRPLLLVVEDDPRGREVMLRILEREGYRVEGVSAGLAAVERIGQGGVSAVLLDMSLPDIPGLDAARRIRALPHFSRVPIVGVTGHTGADEEARCMAVGCSAFVEKPVNWNALWEVLEDLLGATPPAAGLQEASGGR